MPARLSHPVKEQEFPEPGPRDPLEELLGDDLIGVDVVSVQHRHLPGDRLDRFHHSSHSLMSTKWPSIAAAAAIWGLTRCVREPRPWRPSKFRFEVEATRSPGAAISGFMPRHIEHPAPRQSKPAVRKTSSRPSFSASAFTCADPGTTIA